MRSSEIPQEVWHLLRRRVVHFPNASAHHKKLAKLGIEVLGTRVQTLDPTRCRVDDIVFQNVLSSISEVLESSEQIDVGRYELTGHTLRGRRFVRNSDDLVANALYSAAIRICSNRKPDLEATHVCNPREPIRKAWKGVVFRKGRPNGRSIPSRGMQILEVSFNGNLRTPETLFNRPRLKIKWELSVDASQPPALEIRIEGPPVGRLHFRRGRLLATEDERRAASEVLGPAFQFLITQLSSSHEHGKRGRRATFNDRDSALLHYHLGLSWEEIAKRLCKSNHEHDQDCQAKYEQAAKRYYQRAKRSLTPLIKQG